MKKRELAGPQKVGLRLVGDDVLERARREAVQAAWSIEDIDAAVPDDMRVEIYNASLARITVGNAVRDPLDIDRPYVPYAESVLETVFTTATIAALFQELDALSVRLSPAIVPVTDDEIARLAAVVSDPARWGAMPKPRRIAVGRLLKRALEAFDSEG